MKKRILIGLLMVMMFSLSTCFVLAGKPPKTALDVEILKPGDGVEVPYNEVDEACGTFEVTGTVTAKRGDAGLVQTFVQYAIGGSTDFNFVGDVNIQIVSGDEHQDFILSKEQSYGVSWILTGIPDTYEIRIFSQGETAKDGESDSRTVTLLGAPPEPPPEPPTDCETIDDEYVDPENAFGTSSGTFVNTYFVDEEYEVLMEQPNSHGTRNPTDDTADLNWIYEFDDLGTRTNTAFRFVGHIELSGEYLDSGFLEWDDQDTAFYVQAMSSGSWKTIAAITNIGTDKSYFVDVPDDISDTIQLRIVDNDRGYEGKSPQISSLYVDFACIVFEPAFEYIIDDVSFGIQPGIDSLRIGDIDFDGENEVYFTLQLDENGVVRYYTYTAGIWSEETLGLNLIGWMQLEDVDTDGTDDLLTMEVRPNNELWLGYHTYDDEMEEWSNFFHEIGQLLIAHRVVVGDIDGDSLNEVVASKDPCDGYELKYYDYNTATSQWDEIDYMTWPYYTRGLELADIDSDGADEVFWLGNGGAADPQLPIGESALKYFDIVDGGWVGHDILSVDSGECMDIGDVDNDNNLEIVIGHYTQPERESQVRVYEYANGLWEESFNIQMTEALGRPTVVSIGDADNNDLEANELVVGFFDDGAALTNMSIRFFEYDALTDSWAEHLVADPDMTVAAIQIGDLDGDSAPEILVGLTFSYSYSVVAPELRYYKLYQI